MTAVTLWMVHTRPPARRSLCLRPIHVTHWIRRASKGFADSPSNGTQGKICDKVKNAHPGLIVFTGAGSRKRRNYGRFVLYGPHPCMKPRLPTTLDHRLISSSHAASSIPRRYVPNALHFLPGVTAPTRGLFHVRYCTYLPASPCFHLPQRYLPRCLRRRRRLVVPSLLGCDTIQARTAAHPEPQTDAARR